jgi:LysM repeat protein
MAFYPAGGYGKQTNISRRWLYVLLILILAGGILAVLFGINPFRKSQKPAETLSYIDKPPPIKSGAVGQEAKAVQPKLESVPIAKEEPNLAPARREPLKIPQTSEQSDPRAVQLIDEAAECINAKPARIIEARDKLNQALSLPLSKQQLDRVKGKLSELAEEWLFSRKIFPEDKLCASYMVRPGDSLLEIGRKFKVPYEIIQQINNISRPELIRHGEAIKVINGPFQARIYRSSFKLDLYLQSTFVRSFSVGLGKPGYETPTGLWLVKVGGKLEKPIWTDPDTGRTYRPEDPDYPLGSRWIGLDGIEGGAKGRTGFALHGTHKPEEIGAATSRGCIRLLNGDAILMYNLLAEGLSNVIVEE